MGIMDHYVDIEATNQKGSKWEQYGQRATDIINRLNKDLTIAGTQGLIGAAANVISNAKNMVTPEMNKHAEKMASFGVGIKKAAQNAAEMDLEIASKLKVQALGTNAAGATTVPKTARRARTGSYTDTVDHNTFIQTMKEQYGFTEEQAEMLDEAYRKFDEKFCPDTSKKLNDAKIEKFFAYLAALNEDYAVDYKFKLTGNLKEDFMHFFFDHPFNAFFVTPSNKEAVRFFNSLGMDGEALKKAINEQHVNCTDAGKRDFVHECAMFAIMAEKAGTKPIANEYDDVDALIGYKGDIYSGKMNIDDIKSDISAYNLYYRMKNSKNGRIWDTMTEYNAGVENGSINESQEFLARFGNGDPEKGMEELKKEINRETKGTNKLKSDNPESIEKSKHDFLTYVSEESGVDWE